MKKNRKNKKKNLILLGFAMTAIALVMAARVLIADLETCFYGIALGTIGTLYLSLFVMVNERTIIRKFRSLLGAENGTFKIVKKCACAYCSTKKGKRKQKW